MDKRFVLILLLTISSLIGSIVSLSRSRRSNEEEAAQLLKMEREVAQMTAELAVLRERAEQVEKQKASADAGAGARP